MALTFRLASLDPAAPVAAPATLPPTGAETAYPGDARFVDAVLQLGQASLQLAALAQARSTSIPVLALAGRLQAEHASSTRWLTVVAHAQGLATPAAVGQALQHRQAALAAQPSWTFDTAWAGRVATDHQTLLALLRSALQQARAASLRAWAAALLGSVERLLAAARALDRTLH